MLPFFTSEGLMTTRNGNGNGYTAKYGAILQTITVVGMVLGAFWAGIVAPLATRVSEGEKAFLTIREHEAFQLRLDSEIKDIKSTIVRLQGEVVPRSTHELKWKDDDLHFEHLQSTMREVREQIGAAASIKDVLGNLQHQLDAMREKLLVTPAPASSTH